MRVARDLGPPAGFGRQHRVGVLFAWPAHRFQTRSPKRCESASRVAGAVRTCRKIAKRNGMEPLGVRRDRWIDLKPSRQVHSIGL